MRLPLLRRNRGEENDDSEERERERELSVSGEVRSLLEEIEVSDLISIILFTVAACFIIRLGMCMYAVFLEYMC